MDVDPVQQRPGDPRSVAFDVDRAAAVPGIRFLAYDPGPTPRSVGESLKASRHRAGLSQERFARLLGVEPRTLSRWERRTRRPSQALPDRLQALLRTPSPHV
jgi:DNA-binding XRE family transcriptional regulator